MTDAELAWAEAVTDLLGRLTPFAPDNNGLLDRVRARLADLRREREREIEEAGR